MHEYSITKELLRISREKARDLNIKNVKRIFLDLGIMTGYEKESLLYYFDELKMGGDYLSGARLIINEVVSKEIKITKIEGMDENILDESLTARNNKIADEIREILRKHNTYCLNIMGAPGSGKTTLIEGLSKFLEGIYVVQGDLKSDIDTKRLEEKGIGCSQIHTHSGCHLNANMVHGAIKEINLEGIRYLLIENVGNLVCPAGVLIGQDMNITVNSVTEGNDKPEKYPLIFRDSQAIVLSKYDLKEAIEFDEEEYLKRLERVTNSPLFRVSSKDTKSYEKLAEFIKNLK